MNLQLKSFYYKIWIYLPIMILIGIIIFIYTIYTSTFLIPLLQNNYSYDQSITNVEEDSSTLLITMKRVSVAANILVKKIGYSKIDNMPSEEKKGWIYFVIIHFLLLFMLTGFIRTVVTDPGRVPKDWNKRQEEKVKSFRRDASTKAVKKVLETERQIYSNIHKSKENVKKNEEVLDRSSASSRSSKNSKKQSPRQSKRLGQNNNDLVVDIGVFDENENLSKTPEKASNETDRGSEVKSSKIQKGEANIESTVNHDETTPGPDEAMMNKVLMKQYAEHIEKYEEEILRDLLTRNRTRYCNHCQHYKAERTHHCRQCNACTLKMDHHCPWVNNCVGFYNYKFFMVMLIYSVFALWFVWITYTEVVGDTILNEDVGTTLLFIIVIMYMLTLTLAIVVTLFCGFHFWLIYNGKTTLEYCEKNSNIRYDITPWENYKLVFGTNYFLWLFPFSPNYDGEGLEYARIENAK